MKHRIKHGICAFDLTTFYICNLSSTYPLFLLTFFFTLLGAFELVDPLFPFLLTRNFQWLKLN